MTIPIAVVWIILIGMVGKLLGEKRGRNLMWAVFGRFIYQNNGEQR
jgi:hypothetical protein